MAEQTESSVTILADPSAVMAVIADFEAYPDWNQEVTDAEVLSADEQGRAVEVRFVVDAGAIRDEYVLAYEWASPTLLRWHLVRAGMLTAMDGEYALTPVDDGTEVRYRLAVDLKMPMIGMIKRKAEKVIVDRALLGLKGRVEA